MTTIKNYLSLVKFSHTIFALPFALIGFFIGVFQYKQYKLNDSIDWTHNMTNFFFWSNGLKFILVIICMVTARSAAMAFNRWLDKSFDAKNPRTAIREIPAGIISANSALYFVIISCIVFIVSSYFINKICFYLSPIALFVILFYSFTKRFTPLCHLVLGLGLALAPIGSYLAVTGRFDLLPILFSFAVLCWVSGFDIIYALQDIDFDRSQKLQSIPALLGKKKALLVSKLLHVCSAILIISAGYVSNGGWLYWLGTSFFVGMLIYQNSIVKPDDLSRVNLAFMTANGMASVVFATFVIVDLVLK